MHYNHNMKHSAIENTTQNEIELASHDAIDMALHCATYCAKVT